MQTIINPFLIFLFLISGIFPNLEFELISDEYISPEYMCLNKNSKELYIGLSTYPGVAVFNTTSKRIAKIIPMPTPVKGVLIDEVNHKLYAAAGQFDHCIYVYDLQSKKQLKSITTGHGPTDLVASWENGYLFTANRFSNDISVIDIKKQKKIKRISTDREPVAIALSKDERLLAVANLLPSQASTENYISAKITLIDGDNLDLIKNIELPNGSYSLKDIHFSSNGKFIYVTHLLGRYNVLTNQIEKGWINTNALSIINAEKKSYYTTVLLDDIHKGASNPYGLNISEDGTKLFIAISGTNELFVIALESMHQQIEQTKVLQTTSQTTETVPGSKKNIRLFENPSEVAPMGVLFDDIPKELSFLAPNRKRITLTGVGPAHIESDENNIYITSYFSDALEIININTYKSEALIQVGAKDVANSRERYGEMLFHSAEKCFQQWQSCASCHPGNGRVDGLNWDLMNDGIGNPKNTKSLLYSHVTPPAMATGIRADAETGVRAGFKYIQFFDVSEEDAKAVDVYLKSLKPVPSPYLINGKLSKTAKQGQEIFMSAGCYSCHPGTYFTDLQQHDMGAKGKYDKQTVWDTPTLIELWRTAPYMHDGRYNNLKDVFKKEKHGLKEDLSETEVDDLTLYLLSL